ncbi:hypothetical protein JI749_11490 [Devosia oryziradicis]|uniref:Uncharacterized protein n=1 Tax=Devosia oryziradicis TaxID=2801335 RepID=A0ABX7BSS3_9HYPH|nr:hypothetical protein [Devosia oryziradicis]QQR34999.1 hypothetical protein JI749_11490 [Devosia oryziradicis]
MERASVVLEVEVQHEGSAYRASYFVEGNTIHANVGGRLVVAPLVSKPAAETVETLLSGHLQQQSRKLRHSGRWDRMPGRKPAR